MKKVEDAILLAGGEGSRLRPFTRYTSKHLLPVFDKPMIFYPLTNLILMGVSRVFLIINPKHESQWRLLLESLDLDIEIKLVLQKKPEGIPQAIQLCREYINGKSFYLALGDNLILGSGLLNRFNAEMSEDEDADEAVILGHPVKDITKFGIAEFEEDGVLKRVVEKPSESLSNIAIIGLYKFGASACDRADKLLKSARGELEIADLINSYIDTGKCTLVRSNVATDYWLDTGTPDALISASVLLRELHNSGLRNLGDLSGSDDAT